MWDFWENHLDPDRGERKDELQPLPTLPERVEGKVVMVTGATSGIGKASALKLARAGATVLVIARTAEKLEETLHEIDQLGGTAQAYSCDVSDLTDVDNLVQQVLADHGHVDILVNNAGRSIRRSVVHAFDRFHDYERTMQLNYFGALRLIMQLMPSMIENGSGHVINISSIGVLTNAPRFSAYVASKAALDAFTRCAASELAHEGIRFTINMPLVRTPMIAPTKIYNHVPTISPTQAADMICDAIVRQPKRIATNLGVMGQVMHFITPRVTETIMNTGYKLFGFLCRPGRQGRHAEEDPPRTGRFLAVVQRDPLVKGDASRDTHHASRACRVKPADANKKKAPFPGPNCFRRQPEAYAAGSNPTAILSPHRLSALIDIKVFVRSHNQSCQRRQARISERTTLKPWDNSHYANTPPPSPCAAPCSRPGRRYRRQIPTPCSARWMRN